MVADEEVEVVISGIGGYFPKSKNVEELTKMLMEHEDGIDTARWKTAHLDVCDKTGNVQEINLFDSSYFGIHRTQALFMDPMTRMILQNTLEALIDAGETPATVRGRRVLVAAASSLSENDSLMFENVENGFGVTGQARAMMANRISYWLSSTGPSYSCDASWLGGFQVLQHGYDAIRTGQCEAAVITGANLVMNIYPTFHFKNLDLTSPDGVTRAFDENAEGYARSDSTCVMFLQRADQARRRYATLVNAGLMFNGARSGQFIDINPDSARNFLSEFYKSSGIDPMQVNYVEAYGSGVKKIDTIELNLFDQVFNKGKRENPLMIGSIKSNLGHSEACSALTSVVKVLLAMEENVIPANLHYSTPSSEVPALLEGRLKVVTENTPWTGDYAAVNCFGLSSSYGHIILKRNPIERKPNADEIAKKVPLLHVLSTRTEIGLKDVIEKVKAREDYNLDFVNLINGTFTTHIPGYLYRGYVIKTQDGTKQEIEYYSGKSRPVWFIYSGMGSQWLTMGRQLLVLPIFAKAVHKCADALRPLGIDLMHIITTEEEDIFDNILHSFVGIAAIQIGLTDILFSLGISPNGIIGHSVGELGCAYADGCLTSEQMILSAYYRGLASLEADLIPGLMAAVGLGATEATSRVTPTVDIACHNGPDSCTLSGPKEDMEVLVEKLKKEGIFARLVNVSGIAYHSRYIRPAAPLLLKYLEDLIPDPKKRSSKWLSSSVPEARWDTQLARYTSAEYLTNNLLSSVYFEEALKHIPKGAVLIEIAPHGLLQAILRRSVHKESVNIALTKRDAKSGLEFLFTAIGKMYLHGIQMDLTALYKDIYPSTSIVPRGTPHLAPYVRWAFTGGWRTGLDEFKDCSSSEQSYSIDNHGEWFRHVMGHKIHNVSVIPATSYLALVCHILSNTKKVDFLELNNFSVKRHRTLPFQDEYVPPARLMVQRATGLFEISDRYGFIATGQATVPDHHGQQILSQEISNGRDEKLIGKELYILSEDDIYKELSSRGLELNGVYRAITEITVCSNGLKASILWKNWHAFITSIFHSLLLHNPFSLHVTVPGYIRRLIFNFDGLPQENELVQVQYIKTLDTFWSRNMVLEGLRCIKPIGMIRPTIAAAKTKFIPEIVQNDSDIDAATIVDASLQIIKRELSENVTDVHVVVYNDDSTKPVRNILKEISKQNSVPNVRLHVINTFISKEIDSLERINLIIINLKHLENMEKYLQRHTTAYLLVCFEEPHPQIEFKNWIETLSYQKDDYQLKLFKQETYNYYTDEVVNICEEVVNDLDLENTDISWVRELHAKLLHTNGRLYLVCRSLPTNDVDSFVKAVQQLKDGHKAKFVFILDDQAPKVTPTEPFYAHIFQNDLAINVYQNGQWGSRYTTSLKLTDKDFAQEENISTPQEIISPNGISIKVNQVDIKYIGIHADTAIPVENGRSVTPKLGLIDYSGFKKNANKRVMGICNNSLQPDPILQWCLPDAWTYVDGASAPTSYALAYHILVQLAELQSGEHILIHNASTALGQAMIRVATSIGAVIIASVATEKQRSLLLDHMRMLTNDRILDYTDLKFEQQVMRATLGEGVRVVVNCLQGDRLQASIRCLATLGRVVLLQDEHDENSVPLSDCLGMTIFLNCVGMYGVKPTKLCDLDDGMKKQIWQFVQEGMEDRCVVPIRRDIFRLDKSIDHVIRYVTGQQVTGCAIVPFENTQQIQKSGYQCNPLAIYAIYAGENADVEEVLLTILWLANHGTRKLLLVYDPKNNGELLFLQRQLQNTHINIELTKTLPSTDKLHKITAFIVLHGNKVPNSIPTDSKTVVFLGVSPISLIPSHPLRSTLRHTKKSRFADVLPFLGHALSQTVDLKILGNDDDNEQLVEENFTYKDFFRLLASSVSSLANLKPKEKISLKLVSSASPREFTTLPPFFVVPGLLGEKCKYLQQTITKIFSPVYVLNVEYKNQNIEELSALAAEQIRKVYSKGPYNIIGVSTGGILALELAKNLEKLLGSSKVQLYLLDAVPATLQHLLQESRKSSFGLDGVILQYLLQINQPEVANRLLSENKTWQTRLNAALSKFTHIESQRISETLNKVRDDLEEILKYSPSKSVLNAPTRVIRPQVTSQDLSTSLLNCCKDFKLELIKGNHFTMLQSQSLADYINDNTIIPQVYT